MANYLAEFIDLFEMVKDTLSPEDKAYYEAYLKDVPENEVTK